MITHDRATEVSKRPPPSWMSLTEVPRALAEYGGYAVTRPWLTLGRCGNHRPVLVLPGLMADDRSTRELRFLLRRAGYYAHGWGLGRDIGPTPEVLAGLDRRVTELAERHGAPLSLIGWSLGGIMAHVASQRNPAAVERVITLGSPLYITDPEQSSASGIYDIFRAAHDPQYSFHRWQERRRAVVPSTSIYSRLDGVVRWQACVQPDSELTENIEVYCSHLGFGGNSSVAYAVLDRLEAGLEPWQRFSSPLWLRSRFPDPARGRDRLRSVG